MSSPKQLGSAAREPTSNWGYREQYQGMLLRATPELGVTIEFAGTSASSPPSGRIDRQEFRCDLSPCQARGGYGLVNLLQTADTPRTLYLPGSWPEMSSHHFSMAPPTCWTSTGAKLEIYPTSNGKIKTAKASHWRECWIPCAISTRSTAKRGANRARRLGSPKATRRSHSGIYGLRKQATPTAAPRATRTASQRRYTTKRPTWYNSAMAESVRPMKALLPLW
jgi:hypothetical protein